MGRLSRLAGVSLRRPRYVGVPALCVAAIAATICLLLLPPSQYSFYPRCPVHALTGLLCPGCGGTRAVAALLRGHVGEALGWNALVALAGMLAIPACALWALATRVWPERISRAALQRWEQPFAIAALAIAVAFTLWRNLT